MQQRSLEQVEEKFYFKTAHYFWHFTVGLAVLVLFGGALLLFWGLTPSLKPRVKKASYPEPITVTAEEIQKVIKPVTNNVALADKAHQIHNTPSTDTPMVESQIDSSELTYNASIERLIELMPPKKFPWKNRGHYERDWYGRKQWKIDVWGIDNRLRSIYKKVDADNYASKTELLNAYIDLVSLFPLDQRFNVLKAAITYSKDNVQTSIENVALLKKAVAQFSNDKADFLASLAIFGKKNPRDGRAFITYATTFVSQFVQEYRRDILKVLIASYYSYFDKINRQREITDLFLPIAMDFQPEMQAKALAEYYKVYLEKNRDREERVREIDNDYEYALQQAESVLNRKRMQKAENRMLGLQLIVGSVVF